MDNNLFKNSVIKGAEKKYQRRNLNVYLKKTKHKLSRELIEAQN